VGRHELIYIFEISSMFLRFFWSSIRYFSGCSFNLSSDCLELTQYRL